MAGLGIVGFDPLGAIIMLAFVAGGSRLFHIALFTVVNWIVTVAVAVVGGLLFTAVATHVYQWLVAVPTVVWVVLELAAAVAALIWAIQRTRREPTTDDERPPRTASTLTIALASAGFAVAAFVDPGYSAAIVLSASHPVWETFLGMSLWFAITQSPLLVLLVAGICGRTDAAGDWLRPTLARLRRPISVTVTAVLYAAAALLALDALLLSLTGHFLPQL